MDPNTPAPPRGLKRPPKLAQICKACEPAVRLARKYGRELLIAFVLAIVAAVLYEPYKEYVNKKALERTSKAIAELIVFDAKGNVLTQGSGVFISPDGRLVTNCHVLTAEKADHVIARLQQTKAFYFLQNTIGISKRYDLAILQFEANEVPFAKIDKAIAAHLGEHILAVGTPKGFQQTISDGVVSHPERQIEGVDYIQFTAPISPGSSGGGLFNMSGHILGITTQTVSDPKAQNLNFAVPVKYIDKVSEGIKSLQRTAQTTSMLRAP